MGLFEWLFGKKSKSVASAAASTAESAPPQPLSYDQVRQLPSSEERVPLMIQFAEEGNAQALYETGELYLFGKDGVAQDISKGKQNLYKAEEKGIVNAAILLAMFCIKQAFREIDKGKMTQQNQQECLGRFWDHYTEGVGQLAYAISKGNPMAVDILTGTMPLGWNEGDWAVTLIKETSQALPPHMAELNSADTRESNYTLGILSIRDIVLPQDFSVIAAFIPTRNAGSWDE